jgi:rubrerythrin
MPFIPRKIDMQAIRESSIADTLAGIERERRKRVTRNQLEMGEDFKIRGRELGKTDIRDVPSDEPWQARALSELGEIYPYGKHWVCPKCGQVRLGSFPPERCSRCKFEDNPLKRINWRR